jgi:hypothetical protein
MKTAVFWDVVPCSSFVSRRFGRTYRLIFRVEKFARDEPAYASSFSSILHSHRRENLKSYIDIKMFNIWATLFTSHYMFRSAKIIIR